MDGDRVDAVSEWETVSVGRGHAGLRDLAEDGFSGAVTDGRLWVLLTNGKVVGVSGGDIESVADADLTAHRAPDPALPLLFAMQERGGETRARYYTNDTPISEVDETLSSGGFTGYIELSENVLSGDYYVVYYGGEAMPVAFVGNSRRLLTDDEAFRRADDEVGIYEVRAVDVEVTEVPGGVASTEPSDPEPADTSSATDDVVVAASAEEPGDVGDGTVETERGDTAAEAGDGWAGDDHDAVDKRGSEETGAAEGGTPGDADATGFEPDWPTPDLARDPEASAAAAEQDESEGDPETDEGSAGAEPGDRPTRW